MNKDVRLACAATPRSALKNPVPTRILFELLQFKLDDQ